MISIVVHEEMHQRAGCQQEEERQHTEQVRPVFRQQKESRDQEKTDQYPVAPGPQSFAVSHVFCRHTFFLQFSAS
jgi:hypothetical protein